MSGTISGSITIAYTLSVNPTTILPSGTIAVTAGNAIYGSSAVGWSLLNGGLVQGAPAGIGVSLNGTGTITNAAGGTITGGDGAIAIARDAGSVYNAGILSATGGAAGDVVTINGAGSVGNAAHALISGGKVGVDIGTASAPSTVVNRGDITGASQAGVFASAGYVSNAATGLISAGDLAVAFTYAGTVVNAGTLQATNAGGDAVDFATGYANRLVDLPGATFVGGVNGGNTAGSTMASVLELASAASTGTLIGLGTQFTNFATISVDAGAAWRISGSAGGAFALQMLAGAGVTLAAGATLASGNSGNVALLDAPGGGTLVNYGDIAGYAASGVRLNGGAATNASGATISGFYNGLQTTLPATTLVNAGSIVGTGVNGVQLDGGALSNSAGGVILGGDDGVIAATAAASVTNAGSIGQTGMYGSGIAIYAGGTVTNLGGAISGGNGTAGVALGFGGSVGNKAGAAITGAHEGVLLSAAGTVVNAGSIQGGQAGVLLHAGGAVTNAVSGSISGGVGAYLLGGGTLLNAGTIAGGSGTAAAFGGTIANRLVLDPGYGFSGLVVGSASAANTLELASAATAGAVGGLGTEFLAFGAITIDPDAHWTLSGDTTGLNGEIRGFAKHDTIELTGFTATGSSFSGGILTLTETGGSATLDLPGTFTPASFIVTPNAEGTEVTVACFAEGTHLLTTAGEVPVEALAPGDLLATRSGRLRPVRWIGHRRVDAAFPVRIQPDAFGPGMPHRLLRLSPDHAVWCDGALIPARHLCNGATIRQEAAAVVYYHVELDAHDVVLAEGLPAESYLDTGNRAAFTNGGRAISFRYPCNPNSLESAHPWP